MAKVVRYDDKEKVAYFKRNVKYFAKLKHKKIGDLERYAGVNVGYLTRNFASISAVAALKMAEFLEMTVEELFNPEIDFEAVAKIIAKELEEKERNKLSNNYKSEVE